MIVRCEECGLRFDDEFRDTGCPHKTFAANDGQNNFAHYPESYLEKTYRILFIGTRHQLREMGVKHEKVIQDLRTPTWYEPEPGKKAIYGVPPWDKRFLWEVDAPFPAGANPAAPPMPIVMMLVENGGPANPYGGFWRVMSANFGGPVSELEDFFRREFPNQLD